MKVKIVYIAPTPLELEQKRTILFSSLTLFHNTANNGVLENFNHPPKWYFPRTSRVFAQYFGLFKQLCAGEGTFQNICFNSF